MLDNGDSGILDVVLATMNAGDADDIATVEVAGHGIIREYIVDPTIDVDVNSLARFDVGHDTGDGV